MSLPLVGRRFVRVRPVWWHQLQAKDIRPGDAITVNPIGWRHLARMRPVVRIHSDDSGMLRWFDLKGSVTTIVCYASDPVVRGVITTAYTDTQWWAWQEQQRDHS